MPLSIIATRYEHQYYSIRCHHDGDYNASELLNRRTPSESAALRFISTGDISLSRTTGLLLTKNDPLIHASPVAMATYAVESGAEKLHVFEGEAWKTMALVKAHAEDVAESENVLNPIHHSPLQWAGYDDKHH
ncbi:MAG: hypothetical protein ACI9Y1_003128 [Lentisphaeria bacterium]|jgi:hypothetical protein